MNTQISKKSSQMRPSMFLNQFDLNSFVQSPKLKPDQNDAILSPVLQFEESKKKMKLNSQLNIIFPQIKPRFTLKKQKKENPTNQGTQQDGNQLTIVENPISLGSAQISPSGSKLILPNISLCSPQRQLPTHRKNLTEEIGQTTRVKFRASILVIDFVNDILKKDKIDGSSKPLTKRLQRDSRQNIYHLYNNESTISFF